MKPLKPKHWLIRTAVGCVVTADPTEAKGCLQVGLVVLPLVSAHEVYALITDTRATATDDATAFDTIERTLLRAGKVSTS